MTPTEFRAAYQATAQKVSAGTGLNTLTLLAQWGLETGWSTNWAGAPCNLGNIRDKPGSFAQYPSLDVFAQAAIETYHNGYYPAVLAAAGKGVLAEIKALGESPWDAGHYGNPAGSALIPYARSLTVFPLTVRRAIVTMFWRAAFGTDPSEADKTNLAANLKEDGSNWDALISQFQGSKPSQDWKAKLQAASAGSGTQGPPGPPGPPGPAGADGTTPTTGTIAGPLTVTLS